MMKMKITLSLLLLFCLGLNAQKLKISGRVNPEVKTITYRIFNPNSLEYDEVKSTESDNGTYELTVKIDEPNLYKLDFSGLKSVIMSYIHEDRVTVDFLNGKVNIAGSESSADMQNFDQQNGALQQKHFAQLKRDADKAMKAGDRDALKAIQAKSADAIANFLPELRTWIESKGVSPAGYLALQFSDFNKELEYISEQLLKFENELPNSPVTVALSSQVYRAKVLSIGKTPPDFDAVDRAGKKVSFDEYKGKILLVDFWAAWCRACRIENPQFVELYEQFNENGFEIISISQDQKTDVWRKAIEKDGVGIWRNVQDKNKLISELYAVKSLPQNIVVGKEGRIIGKNVNAEELKELLNKML